MNTGTISNTQRAASCRERRHGDDAMTRGSASLRFIDVSTSDCAPIRVPIFSIARHTSRIYSHITKSLPNIYLALHHSAISPHSDSQLNLFPTQPLALARRNRQLFTTTCDILIGSIRIRTVIRPSAHAQATIFNRRNCSTPTITEYDRSTFFPSPKYIPFFVRFFFSMLLQDSCTDP